jgi:hypothetical protein
MQTPSLRFRRSLAGGVVVAIAAVGLSLVAMPAEAATGHANLGVKDVALVADAPRTAFRAPGTTGTLQWTPGDGTAAGALQLSAGESDRWGFALPDGLKFAGSPCAWADDSDMSWSCTVSATGRDLSVMRTMKRDLTWSADSNAKTERVRVVSTGLISGPVSATYTPFPGATTAAPVASATVPGSVAPLVVTGTGTPAASGDVMLSGTADLFFAYITVKNQAGGTIGTASADRTTGAWTVRIPAGTTGPLTITQLVRDVESTPVHYTVRWPAAEVTAMKTAVPASGTPVVPGQVVTYTLTYTNTGNATGVVDSTDELSDVFDDGAYVAGTLNSSEPGVSAALAGDTLRVSGNLAANASVTITYQVTVARDRGRGDGKVRNVLIGDDPRLCAARASCETAHDAHEVPPVKPSDPPVTAQPVPGAQPTAGRAETGMGASELARTGSDIVIPAGIGLTALIAGAVVFMITRRSLSSAATGQSPDDL